MTNTRIVPSHKFIISDDASWGAAVYVLLINKEDGGVVNGTTGVSSATETWANGGIAGSQETITDMWEFTMPPLDPDKEYIIIVASRADTSYAKADTRTYTGGYSPITRCVIDEGMPWARGKLAVRS